MNIHTLNLGTAPITNGTATVAVDGLECGVAYTIIVGGTLNEHLVGPRSSHGTVTAGPCPINNMTSNHHMHVYLVRGDYTIRA